MKKRLTLLDRVYRILTFALVPALVLGGVPVVIAQPATPPAIPTSISGPPISPNRSVPRVTPPPLRPYFSNAPKAAELAKARVFEEPLVASGTTSIRENRALANALQRYLDRAAAKDMQPLEAFLEGYPRSPWRVSVLANLGLVAHESGYVTKALRFHEEAWRLGKDASEPHVRALAERSVSELAWLQANLGHQDALERLLGEIGARDFSGSAAERIDMSRQALFLMQTRPSEAFRCGPVALGRVLLALGHAPDERITHAPATARGTSLAQVRSLAARAGVSMLAAKRTRTDAALPVPAVIHFKTGHFGAVIERSGGRYLIADPVFEGERWLSEDALNQETSGYVLAATLPSGFERVDDDEAATVWGRSCPSNPDPTQQNCEDQSGGGGGCGSGACPMAQYTFLTLMAALRIWDTPLAYTPPKGPSFNFKVTYNQREMFQPAVFSYVNMGPKWTFDAISYVEDDATAAGAQTIKVYQRGGGMEVFANMPAGAGAMSAPEFRHRTVLVRVSTDPIKYERRSPDGSVETFAQPDGGAAFPRKVFLTEEADPQGNKLSYIYGDALQLEAIVDALGQVTTLSYADLVSRRITSITDPFGRTATFGYDSQGRLISITDALGLTSSFTYGQSDFIASMTTPYGTTEFSTGSNGSRNWIEAKDPLGARERLEYVRIHDSTIGPNALPGYEVPTGFEPFNANFDAALTLYWDKRAMLLAPQQLGGAEIKHWLENPSTHQPRGIMRAHKKAAESRVWYAYEGQVTSHGNDGRLTRMGRLLSGGSQIWEYTHNLAGKVCTMKDPLGRETRYTYGSNNVPDGSCATGSSIDLLKLEQKNPAAPTGWDVVQTLAYNPDSMSLKHLPLTITDGANQTTTYTYNTAGQIATVTTPLRPAFPSEQRTTTYAYQPVTGYLQSVVSPGNVATSYTYDAYGRMRTMTDNDNDTTTYDYDIFDRPTRTTYPDSTYEETVYDRLDARGFRDRLGRWSETLHDPLRRVVSTRDPANRVVTQEWCICGSLDRLVDPSGNATTWERDVQGRVTKEVRADGSFKAYGYDTASRLSSTVDAKSQSIQYTYALDDRLLQTTYLNPQIPTPNVILDYTVPAAGGVPAHPDPHGRLRRMTDGSGGTGDTIYNYVSFQPLGSLGAGQIQSIDGPLGGDTITYTYDELGRVLTRTYDGVTSTWNYDQQWRLDNQVDSGIGTFDYAYVGNTPRLNSLTYPNGQTSTYSYFAAADDRRLSTISHRGPGGTPLENFDYTYDDAGNILTWGRGMDGARAERYHLEYDQVDQLAVATLKNFNGAATLKRYRYAYDPAGNRTAEQIDDAATGATHDNMNRLLSQQPGGYELFRGTTNEPARVTVQAKQATVTPGNQFTGSAQVTGTQTDVVVEATDYASPKPNVTTNTYSVTQSGSSRSFAYDPNGNLSSKTEGGVTTTYEWDAEDRLVTVKQGTATIGSFTYDGEGRRRTKFAGGITTTYIWDSQQVVQERSSFSADRRYIDGRGIDHHLALVENDAPTYFLADHLGSIVRTTNASGGPVLTRSYDPWGTALQGTSTSGYAFTGREWDPEIGLYYYRARYFDPRLGRFVSQDPLGVAAGPNRYEYVDNDPIAGSDPFGLMSHQDCLQLAGKEFILCENSARLTQIECEEGCRKRYPGAFYYIGRLLCIRDCSKAYKSRMQECRDQYEADVRRCYHSYDPSPDMLPPPVCIA